MISGARGQQIIFLLLLLYIYYWTYKNINWGQIIIAVVIIYLGSTFLNALAIIRNYNSINIDLFFDIYKTTLANNPIFLLVTELGSTIQTTFYVTQKVPKRLEFGMGETYYKSFLTVFPNLFGILDQINYETSFVKNLNVPFLGGSYIGELYYNFGWIGSIFGFLFGFAINVFSRLINTFIQQKRHFSLVFFVSVWMSGLWWVRDRFSTTIRQTIWTAIILILAEFISRSFKNKKYKI